MREQGSSRQGDKKEEGLAARKWDKDSAWAAEGNHSGGHSLDICILLRMLSDRKSVV